MGRTKQTNKFDRYLDFLDANIFGHQQCMLEDKQCVDLCRELKKLLEKKSCGERIVLSDYKKLASISCPDEETAASFFGMMEEKPENLYLHADGCPDTECADCWKKYINSLVANINDSNAFIKKFVPDPVHKRFEELETMYADPEDSRRRYD